MLADVSRMLAKRPFSYGKVMKNASKISLEKRVKNS